MRIDYLTGGETSLSYIARLNDGSIYTVSEGQCTVSNTSDYDTLLYAMYAFNWVPLADYVGDSKSNGNLCNMFVLGNVSNPDGGMGSFVACFANDTPLQLKTYAEPLQIISDVQFATFTPSVAEGSFKIPAICGSARYVKRTSYPNFHMPVFSYLSCFVSNLQPAAKPELSTPASKSVTTALYY